MTHPSSRAKAQALNAACTRALRWDARLVWSLSCDQYGYAVRGLNNKNYRARLFGARDAAIMPSSQSKEGGMKVRLIATAIAIGLTSAPASAQWGNYFRPIEGAPLPIDTGVGVVPSQTYVMTVTNVGCPPFSSACIAHIPLTAFASGNSRQADALSSLVSRALETSTIAAAMADAIPNKGDRFAVRLNAAGSDGNRAGAISVGYNVNDFARLHLNYGQGRTQSLVSGGLNLSFR